MSTEKVTVAVLPLINLNSNHLQKANQVLEILIDKGFYVVVDNQGSLPLKEARHDKIGTDYCIIIDDETLSGDTKDTVTVRYKNDSGYKSQDEQRKSDRFLRVSIDKLHEVLL